MKTYELNSILKVVENLNIELIEVPGAIGIGYQSKYLLKGRYSGWVSLNIKKHASGKYLLTVTKVNNPDEPVDQYFSVGVSRLKNLKNYLAY